MNGLVVFDLDGTLVDSRQDLASSVNDVLAIVGAPRLPTERVAAMVGDGARSLLARALEATGCGADLDDALAHFHRCYGHRLLETTTPYPGVDELLRELGTSAHLAVLTNKPTDPTHRLLDHFGWLQVFGRVIGGDGPFPRKPDPAGLRDLMSWARVGPEGAMLVGDSMVDVLAARNAGVTVCVAGWGFGQARGDLHVRQDEWVAGSAPDVSAWWSRVRGAGKL